MFPVLLALTPRISVATTTCIKVRSDTAHMEAIVIQYNHFDCFGI